MMTTRQSPRQARPTRRPGAVRIPAIVLRRILEMPEAAMASNLVWRALTAGPPARAPASRGIAWMVPAPMATRGRAMEVNSTVPARTPRRTLRATDSVAAMMARMTRWVQPPRASIPIAKESRRHRERHAKPAVLSADWKKAPTKSAYVLPLAQTGRRGRAPVATSVGLAALAATEPRFRLTSESHDIMFRHAVRS